jgi:hypothetical protein
MPNSYQLFLPLIRWAEANKIINIIIVDFHDKKQKYNKEINVFMQ